MPCTDGGVPYPPTQQETLDSKAPAMLCALLTPLAAAQLNKLCAAADWEEAGVSVDEFLEWWKGHVEKDQKRLVEQALSKLTPAERRALKVPDGLD